MVKHVRVALFGVLTQEVEGLAFLLESTYKAGMNKKINPYFGKQLKRLRGKIAQQRFAQQSGLPLGTVRDVEQGRREPGLATMQRWVAALKELGVEASLDSLLPVVLDEDLETLAAQAIAAFRAGNKDEGMRLATRYRSITGRKVILNG